MTSDYEIAKVIGDCGKIMSLSIAKDSEIRFTYCIKCRKAHIWTRIKE